jgi:hypothetical protein
MKKWHFLALLVVGSAVLGATVFREPIARAAQATATTIVGPLDSNGNVKVHEQGTATVSGTVGISSSANTVGLDPTASGQLDTANAHLANVDSATSKLTFDADGNLKTADSMSSPASFVFSPVYSVDAGGTPGGIQTIQFGRVVRVSLFNVSEGGDTCSVGLYGPSGNILYLTGPGCGGTSNHTVPFSQPVEADRVVIGGSAAGGGRGNINVIGS